jgi:hypothetical protein
MLVRALEACFIDGHRRRAGAEFEYAGKKLPPHLVPVKGASKPEAVKPDVPVALSEMAKGDGKSKSFIDSVSKPKPKSPEK